MNKTAVAILALSSSLLAACATNSIPDAQKKDYALLVPGEKGGSPDIVTVDQESFHRSLMGSARDVLPGRHAITMETCFENKANLLAPRCESRHYVIEAKAGQSYVFVSPSAIAVFDRFDKTKHLYDLLPTEHSIFLPPDEAKQFYAQQLAAQEAAQDREKAALAATQAAIAERRRNNLHLVRKVGTRICQERERGVIYVGYVEALADEKVQIRISDAHYKDVPSAHPGGFSPSIIWDSPMNWDLCE